MMTNDFEQAFAEFLDRREYDEAEAALFVMVRTAFLAGRKAAGSLKKNRNHLLRNCC